MEKNFFITLKSMKGSLLPVNSLMECMARVGASTSTALIPVLDDIAGPIVLPHGIAFLITPGIESFYILVDDLTNSLIIRHHRLPTRVFKNGRMVVEISSGNYQVWINPARTSIQDVRFPAVCSLASEYLYYFFPVPLTLIKYIYSREYISGNNQQY